MATQIFYVDESFDGQYFCLVGFWIQDSDWSRCLDAMRKHRAMLKNRHGIRIKEEIHSRDLVAGRGKISAAGVSKWERSRIFLGMLRLVASLPIRAINICIDVNKHPNVHLLAWDRLVNRAERTMKQFEDVSRESGGRLVAAASRHLSEADATALRRRLESFCVRAVFISDEGHERDMTKALRRMRIYNPIPSQFGEWSPGIKAKSITADHIIEDPVFRKSDDSHFLQLADCMAFALLKRESSPTKNVKKYGIHKMFDSALHGVCYQKAASKDPLGIVRS
jgi:hypothetical protein